MSKTTTITSPSAAAMPDEHTSFFGDRAVTFRKGVAKIEDCPDSLRGYFEANGFGVDGSEPESAPEPTEPPDPRDYDTPTVVGTDLRDGAVDPRPDDFLPPINAGQDNPHGSGVVAPGIHAEQGVRPVKAGPVTFDGDTAAQSISESLHTEAAHDGTPITLTEDERDLIGVPDHAAPAPTVADSETAPAELKGEALDAKLDELGLAKDGTADDKRERVRVATTDAADLKGADLEAALRDAGLPVNGTADEKRDRLAQHRTNPAPPDSES